MAEIMKLDIRKLAEAMRREGWDEDRLAAEMGIGRPMVNRLLNGKRGPGMKVFAGLRRAFPYMAVESFFTTGEGN